MAVYNDKQPVEKIEMANNFINFLISNQTQADIGKLWRGRVREVALYPDECQRPERNGRLGRGLHHSCNGSFPLTGCGSNNRGCITLIPPFFHR